MDRLRIRIVPGPLILDGDEYAVVLNWEDETIEVSATADRAEMAHWIAEATREFMLRSAGRRDRTRLETEPPPSRRFYEIRWVEGLITLPDGRTTLATVDQSSRVVTFSDLASHRQQQKVLADCGIRGERLFAEV